MKAASLVNHAPGMLQYMFCERCRATCTPSLTSLALNMSTDHEQGVHACMWRVLRTLPVLSWSVHAEVRQPGGCILMALSETGIRRFQTSALTISVISSSAGGLEITPASG